MIPSHLIPSEDPLVLAMKNTATPNVPQLEYASTLEIIYLLNCQHFVYFILF